jgi:nicotinamidase-related amidase
MPSSKARKLPAPMSGSIRTATLVSGMVSSLTSTNYLKREGIHTLLFFGVNMDQCVGATLQDANAQGFDTIMLKDGCGTDSLPYAKASYEFNCARC